MPTRGMRSDEVNKGGASSMTSEQREIFSEIYIDNWPKLLRYAKANKWCAGVAEELVQDTFHDAWSKFGELSDHENIGGWLILTLKNKMRNYIRSRQRDVKLFAEYLDRPEDIAAPDNFVNKIITVNALSTIQKFICDNFKDDDVVLFQRVIVDGKSHKDAAEELGITVWASQKRIERMRKKIKEEFPDF